ncbi:MAG: hypothetical protein R3E44_11755 [Paracoccaceae bacterium]
MVRRQLFPLLTGTIVCGALVLAGIGEFDEGPKSPFAWLQYPLLLLLAGGLFTTPESGQGKARLLPFLGLSWILGMSVELSLTVDGSGIGGVHADTFSSFVLAQGDYIPLAIVIWSFHRRMGCLLHELAWITIGMGLTEGLVFTGSVTSALASWSVVGALAVTCYLIAIYMVFLLLPFRLCGVAQGETSGRIPQLVVLGFASAFAVRVFWGVVYSPIATAIFDLSID